MDLKREEKTYFRRNIALCSCVLRTFRQYCSSSASSVHVIEQHNVHETRLKTCSKKLRERIMTTGQMTAIMGAPNHSSKTQMISVPTLKKIWLWHCSKGRGVYSRHKVPSWRDSNLIVLFHWNQTRLSWCSVSQTDLLCDLHGDHCDVIGIEKGRRRCPCAGAGAGQSSSQYIIPNQNQVSTTQASLLNLLFHR